MGGGVPWLWLSRALVFVCKCSHRHTHIYIIKIKNSLKIKKGIWNWVWEMPVVIPGCGRQTAEDQGHRSSFSTYMFEVTLDSLRQNKQKISHKALWISQLVFLQPSGNKRILHNTENSIQWERYLLLSAPLNHMLSTAWCHFLYLPSLHGFKCQLQINYKSATSQIS